MSRVNRSALFVVIVGCGRLGSHLAGRLSTAGHNLVVVDIAPASFGLLPPEYSGFTVEGDASELAVLARAKLDQADVVIAATREDNLNLMVAQLATQVFGAKRALARVLDPSREEVYRALSIETICPTTAAADMFADLVLSAPAQGV